MNSRQDFLTAVNHSDPGRLVLDFGATAVTGIHVQTISKLRRHYGLQRKPIRIIEPFQMLGEVGWEMVDSIGIDVVGAWNRTNIFGISNHAPFKEWKTPWGQRVMVPLYFNTGHDAEGNILACYRGNAETEPCARMPKQAFAFETSGNLQQHTQQNPVTEKDLEHWQIEVDKAYYSGKAVVADLGVTTPGNLDELLKQSGKELETAINKATEQAIESLQKIFATVGNKINAVLFCKQHFALKPAAHNEQLDGILFPFYQKLNDWIHDNTAWLTMKHSGVFTETSIERIIRAGFDILHLSETSEKMEPLALKKSYGHDLIFWGGGLSTQTLLAGKPEQVRAQLLQRCEILAKDGGYVFNTAGNIPASVPVENFVAMLDAIREFNGK